MVKTLDMDKVASKYLFKQLSKTKRIAESPPFAHFKESKSRIPTDGPQTPAEANVLARLYKSNPVKNLLPGIMDGFRKILKLDESMSAERTKGQDGDKKEVKKIKEAKKDAAADAEDHEMEDASDDDDDLAQFDSRLASNSNSEDEESNDDDDNHNDAMSITPSASPSLSPEPSPQPTKKPKQQPSKPTPATSTTFLPSLSMGGYVSGSESEDPDAENESQQPVRKNRMGQQARRALWEKKYGAGAKHVRAQQEKEKRDRDRGWDMKRGATGASGGGGREKKKMDGSRPRPQRDNAGHGQKQGKKEDDKPMHPSWEAARKAKEAQKNTMAFQGKKVTFD